MFCKYKAFLALAFTSLNMVIKEAYGLTFK